MRFFEEDGDPEANPFYEWGKEAFIAAVEAVHALPPQEEAEREERSRGGSRNAKEIYCATAVTTYLSERDLQGMDGYDESLKGAVTILEEMIRGEAPPKVESTEEEAVRMIIAAYTALWEGVTTETRVDVEPLNF